MPKGGIYEGTHFATYCWCFCCIISGRGRYEGKENQADHRGRRNSQTARQYPTCSEGRAPSGAANVVATILFRYASRRDEEKKRQKSKLALNVAALANLNLSGGLTLSASLSFAHSGVIRCRPFAVAI